MLAVRVQMLPAVAMHPRSHPTNQPRHYEYSYSYKGILHRFKCLAREAGMHVNRAKLESNVGYVGATKEAHGRYRRGLVKQTRIGVAARRGLAFKYLKVIK